MRAAWRSGSSGRSRASPTLHAIGQDRGEEIVGAGESLGFALEIYLAVFIEVVLIDGDAGVENGVQLVAVGAAR